MSFVPYDIRTIENMISPFRRFAPIVLLLHHSKYAGMPPAKEYDTPTLNCPIRSKRISWDCPFRNRRIIDPILISGVATYFPAESDRSIRVTTCPCTCCFSSTSHYRHHHEVERLPLINIPLLPFLTMKASILSTFVLALAATKVTAFPNLAAEHRERLAASQQGKRSTAAASPHKKRVVFDAKSQYVSTTGDHSFGPPNYGAGDVRGPCPGLNAAANHNYISRNGVATMGDFIKGVNEAYGSRPR
jgi:hypothetical protein